LDVGRKNMKQVLFAVAALFLASHVMADRAVYTAECADGATLVGVWRPSDVVRDGDDIRLKRPDTLVKGAAANIRSVKQYSSRLRAAAQRIENEGAYILFIRVDGKRADLVADSGRLPYNSLSLKATKLVVQQLELKKKWTTLSVEEQVEKSDLIVSGSIPDEGPECPKDYTVALDATYRGVPPKRLSVLPVQKEQLAGKHLFFIQRHVGTGPNHIVMNAVPIKDAKAFLNRLKKKGISQPQN
jgi:hypothetical protein